ncbi:MAG: hypothetical protein LBF89_11215 [Bacteroidales bacterium]|nr:hypothetical protein [Bacteroidales bacterium]
MCELIALASFLVAALLAVIVIPLIPCRYKAYAALAVSMWIAAVSSWQSVCALTGKEVSVTLTSSFMWGNVSFVVDALSSWFILVVNLMILPGIWYSRGYLRGCTQPANLSLHYVMLVWMHLALCMVCMVQNGLAFIFVWEIMSLASFLLVIFESQQRNVLQAGLNYLVQMHISVIFLLIAFLIVYQSEGGFEFSNIGAYFATHKNFPLFLLFFAGFGFKAGIVPLHTWLPHAHPAAPSHVSGIMSGVIVKMGIYGIFRMISYLNSDLLLTGNAILITGMFTGIYGILHASLQRDVKRLLAYCTIENVGIILMGTGLGLVGQHAGNAFLMLAGYGSALLHVLNHALSKELLFLCAGTVYRSLHTRNMDRMGGLFRSMPHSALLFLTGSLAMAGLPPLNGFISEFVLFFGFVKGVIASDITESILIVMGITAMSLIGGLSVLTFTKSFGVMFLGHARVPFPSRPEEPAVMRYPQYVLAALMALVALTPFVVFGIVSDIVVSVFHIPFVSEDMSGFGKLLQRISMVMIMFISLVLFLASIRRFIAARQPERKDDTWGCGSPHAGSRMQYTAGSFAKPVGKLFGSLIPFRKKYRRMAENDPFPESARYAYSYGDWVETVVFAFVKKRLKRFSSVSLHIQDGRLQWYILYGLLFILAVILLTWMNVL